MLLLLSTLHEQIRAVGFDMDYTLAQYYSAFDLLAFEGAREKLVKNLGYPAEVAQFEYDPNHFARGLVIDKQRGNIIKVSLQCASDTVTTQACEFPSAESCT